MSIIDKRFAQYQSEMIDTAFETKMGHALGMFCCITKMYMEWFVT